VPFRFLSAFDERSILDMARDKAAKKRTTEPDPMYRDDLVSRFVNAVMRDGKKSLAQRIVYDSFDVIEERTGEQGLEVFKKAVNNVAPLVEVRSRRVGGATYQVPIEVRPDRRVTLAFRWIIQYARARKENSMANRLASELINAARGEGGAVKKKDDTHRMAESNKAFAHFSF
jgi:small subunit ribosomal protein S7